MATLRQVLGNTPRAEELLPPYTGGAIGLFQGPPRQARAVPSAAGRAPGTGQSQRAVPVPIAYLH